MAAELTDVAHWEKYWEGFEPARFDSHKIDPLVDQLPDGISALEIGGFPGQISAYLRRRKQFDISILDFFVVAELVTKTEAVFGLEPNSIKCRKADFFDHGIEQKFDLVHSHGFIEHFEDPTDILRRHLELTNDGGHVLVSMPNLRHSFYGWVIQRYDRPLYDTHNVSMMDLDVLRRCCDQLDVTDYTVRFLGVSGSYWMPEGKVPTLPGAGIKLTSRLLGAAFGEARSQRLAPTIGILIAK